MLFIVLPAYNEEEALPLLLKDIEETCRGIPHRLVLVDDASTDNTLKVMKAYAEDYSNIDIVHHDRNTGLGGALASGFRHILAHRALNGHNSGPSADLRADVVITMDADNTHPADRIPLMLDKIERGADLVIASRYTKGGEQYGLSSWRRILSWGAGKIMGFFFPISGVQDYSSGYRAYRLKILASVIDYYGDSLIESKSFAAMVELLLKVVPYCREIAEIPLILHYEKKKGMSKMKVFATIKGYLQLIYRFKRETWRAMKWVEE